MNKKRIIIIVIITIIIGTIFIKVNTKSLLFKIFDFSILTISSGSMEPEIQIGEAIIIKREDTYEIGDIITYSVKNTYLVTHRIVGKEEENYITKGDNNNSNDNGKLIQENIEGKVIHHSKFVNYLVKFIPIVIIILFILILIFL